MFKQSLNTLVKTWRSFMPGSERNGASNIELDDRLAKKVRSLIQDCLVEKGGAISARQRAARLGSIYLNLALGQRKRYLNILADCLIQDRKGMIKAAENFLEAPNAPKAAQTLRHSLQGAHRMLLKQFNALPEGIHFLVNMRADLLDCMENDSALIALDGELCSLLTDWFDIGFLNLVRIDWDSPASLLEKLVDYEAVHEIDSWHDLRNRLESDRRCYAFFHPGMPAEPLIFIEIALVNGISRNIQELLDTDAVQIDPHSADTAIFYSISNTQKGLRGISFGNFLIKRVVEDLRSSLPNLKNFSTLSPLPGFGRWLKQRLKAEETSGLIADLRKAVLDVAQESGEPLSLDEIMARPDWREDSLISDLLKGPMLRLCAQYLQERRSNNTALDPVEHFHLGNGAVLEQINWQGDFSDNGVQQAYGLMVNYLYKLDEIEKNHEAYATSQQIKTSSQVAKLLKS
jgi:malonyl-CoA decarboxylase